MKKILSLIFIVLFSQTTLAQTQPWDPQNPEHLKETGKLFTVQIVPGKKQASLYIVGNKAAEVKFNKLKIEATLFAGGKEHKLELKRNKDHFVSKSPLLGEELELNVQGENPEQVEKLRIKLKNP